jgi:hypothetical protein
MLRLAVRGHSGGARVVRFSVHVRNEDRGRTPPLVRLQAVCGPGDQGEPVVTVLMPHEDFGTAEEVDEPPAAPVPALPGLIGPALTSG